MLDHESLHLLISRQLPVILSQQTYRTLVKSTPGLNFIQVWIALPENSVAFLLKSLCVRLFTFFWMIKYVKDVYTIVPCTSWAASSANNPCHLLGSVSSIIGFCKCEYLCEQGVDFVPSLPVDSGQEGSLVSVLSALSPTGHLVLLNLECPSHAPGLLSVVKGTWHAGV